MEDKKQAMATVLKTIGLFLSSIFYGFISCWWLILAIVCMFPESGPGEKEWIEDSQFIPWGYIMAISWLIVTGICMFSLRKKKSNMMIYIMTTIFSIGITFLILLNQ
ncbi:MAG: hypothetical protein ACLRZ9_12490 [Eubacterium sp.]